LPAGAGCVRVYADEGAPMSGLLGRLPVGCLAGPAARGSPPRPRLAGRAVARPRPNRRQGATEGSCGRAAGPGRAADLLRAGDAAAARRGQVRPAHRHGLVALERSKSTWPTSWASSAPPTAPRPAQARAAGPWSP